MTKLPTSCERALQVIEQDPLNLPVEVLRHVQVCPACAEARVLWLAQEPAADALAPAGYFEALPLRIQRKLPQRRTLSRTFLWAAAALLIALAGSGGYLAGRAKSNPVRSAELARPAVEVVEPVVTEAPFADRDEELGALQKLSEEERAALLSHLKSQNP